MKSRLPKCFATVKFPSCKQSVDRKKRLRSGARRIRPRMDTKQQNRSRTNKKNSKMAQFLSVILTPLRLIGKAMFFIHNTYFDFPEKIQLRFGSSCIATGLLIMIVSMAAIFRGYDTYQGYSLASGTAIILGLFTLPGDAQARLDKLTKFYMYGALYAISLSLVATFVSVMAVQRRIWFIGMTLGTIASVVFICLNLKILSIIQGKVVYVVNKYISKSSPSEGSDKGNFKSKLGAAIMYLAAIATIVSAISQLLGPQIILWLNKIT